MGGFSVVVTLIITCLIIACVILILAFIGVECFIGATVSAIVLAIKRNDIKISGSKMGWKLSIPIVLYLISFSIFFLFVFFIGIINCNI